MKEATPLMEKERDSKGPRAAGKGVVNAPRFYERFDGHPPSDLRVIVDHLRAVHGQHAHAIFLAGDSSLDNKHWLYPNFNQSIGTFKRDKHKQDFTSPALNGYENVLRPPQMVRDVCYWMNALAEEADPEDAESFTINTAVEASTLSSRVGGCEACFVPVCSPKLFPQDRVIADTISENDYLVISVGGNDIAMAPSIFTVFFMLLIVFCPMFLLGPWHPGVMYFSWMFKSQIRKYIKKLTKQTVPSKIAVCMIYYPDEENKSSWANPALYALCYCCAPSLLQARIQLAFELGTQLIELPGTTVVHVALSDALDGKSPEDYRFRVEPSDVGARKIAALLLDRLS